MNLQQNNQAKSFIIANQISSTNTLIKSYPENTILISQTQTEGRGQFGRKWFSPPGNLYFSLKINQTKLSQIKEESLTKSFFVALVKAINKYKRDFELEEICKQKLFFKAPNDLLNQTGKKLAGILVERIESSLIVGIGVNFKESEKQFAFFNWGKKKSLEKFSLYLTKAIYDLERASNQEIIDFIKIYEKR